MRKPSGGGAGHAVPGFLLPFGCRPSLLGSSCARWGVEPSSRSAYRRQSAGPQRGCRVAHEQDPTGQGAPFTPGTVVRSRPATILRPAPAAFQRPVPTPRWNIPSAGVTFTRRHQGFTHVRPSPQTAGRRPEPGSSPLPAGLLLACGPRMERGAASASTPGFAPRGYPRRTPRRRQAIAHWPEYYTFDISRTSKRCLPLHSCTLTSHPAVGRLQHHLRCTRRHGPSPRRRYSGSLEIRTVSRLLTGLGHPHQHRPAPMQIDPDELPSLVRFAHRGLLDVV